MRSVQRVARGGTGRNDRPRPAARRLSIAEPTRRRSSRAPLVPGAGPRGCAGQRPIVAWWRSPDLLRASAQHAQGRHVAVARGARSHRTRGGPERSGGTSGMDWAASPTGWGRGAASRSSSWSRAATCGRADFAGASSRWRGRRDLAGERCSSTMRRSRGSQSTSRSPAPHSGHGARWCATGAAAACWPTW